MLAKVIATGADRAEAFQRLATALEQVRIAGPKTNLAFLSAIAGHPQVRAGGVDTGFVDRQLHELIGGSPDPALAAAAIVDRLRRESGRFAATLPGPWARTDAFEPGGLERRTGVAVQIDATSRIAEVAWSSDGPSLIGIDGSPVGAAGEAQVVWGGEEAFVLQDGRQLQVSFPDPMAQRPDAENPDGEIFAPMNGRVVTVSVISGLTVEKGAPLFTLEAMKMEHSVTAPVAGTVRLVRVAPGMQVEQGSLALSIEPGESGAGPAFAE
jgi:3-methylcrotonyl-CoA carboxylase alpha subunit